MICDERQESIMNERRKYFILVLAMSFFIMTILTGCRPWTIVKNDERTKDENGVYFSNTDFDVNAYVNDIWDNKLFPYYDEKKQDAAAVLSDIKNDVDAAGENYGFGSSDQGSTWNFVIEGKGKVIEVDQASRAGFMSVDLAPYDGTADLKLQTGPVIKGTSIRDTVDSIKLSDFPNQVLYASISKTFNGKVLSDVIGKLDLNTLKDKEITFLGAFTYTSADAVMVTPVKIEVGGQ